MADIIGGALFFKLGARLSMFCAFLTSVLGAIGLIFVFNSDNPVMISLFVGISKFGISAAFNMIYICFMELIPTIFTATVFGYSNTAARVVTILAPQIAEVKGVLPQIINLVLAGVGALSSFFIIQKMPRFV